MHSLDGQPYIHLLFLQLLNAHNIVNMRPNILKLSKYTNFGVLFLMTVILNITLIELLY
jgi:hypothetical protein